MAITNGDFETGDFTGWTASSGGVTIQSASGGTYGSYWARLNRWVGYPNAYLSQTFTTNGYNTLNITYHQTQSCKVFINLIDNGTFYSASLQNYAGTGYATIPYSIAGHDTVTLQVGTITSTSLANSLFIDNVVLSNTPVLINVSDKWEIYDSMKINIGDSWKDVVSVKQNIGDAWKTVF